MDIARTELPPPTTKPDIARVSKPWHKWAQLLTISPALFFGGCRDASNLEVSGTPTAIPTYTPLEIRADATAFHENVAPAEQDMVTLTNDLIAVEEDIKELNGGEQNTNERMSEEMIAELSPSIFRISYFDSEGGRSRGSAVNLGYSLLTAKHVAPELKDDSRIPDEEAMVVYPFVAESPGATWTSLAFSKLQRFGFEGNADWLLFHVADNASKRPYVELADKNVCLKKGDILHYLTHPGGEPRIIYQRGVYLGEENGLGVTAFKKGLHPIRGGQIGRALKGSSGGPVFTKAGKLLGIHVQGVLKDTDALIGEIGADPSRFAINPDEVKQTLERFGYDDTDVESIGMFVPAYKIPEIISIAEIEKDKEEFERTKAEWDREKEAYATETVKLNEELAPRGIAPMPTVDLSK